MFCNLVSLKSSNGIIHRVEDSQNLNSYCEFKNHFLQSATFGKLWTLKSFGSQIFLKLLSLVDSFKTIGFLKCFICLIKDLSLNYLSTSDYQNKAKQNNKQTKKPTAFALKKKKTVKNCQFWLKSSILWFFLKLNTRICLLFYRLETEIRIYFGVKGIKFVLKGLVFVFMLWNIPYSLSS